MKVKLLTDGGYSCVAERGVVGKVFNAFLLNDRGAFSEYIVEIPGVGGGILSEKGRMFLASEIEILKESDYEI